MFEFEYHLHNYWEIQHPLRTVGFQEYDGDVLWCMNTNTKNIFGTSDGFVLIIRATRINNKLISGETISPVIYLVFLSQGGLYFSNTKKYIEPLVQDHSGPPDHRSLDLRPGLVPGATSASPRIIMVTSHLTPQTPRLTSLHPLL